MELQRKWKPFVQDSFPVQHTYLRLDKKVNMFYHPSHKLEMYASDMLLSSTHFHLFFFCIFYCN
jgi:hypothetical protein